MTRQYRHFTVNGQVADRIDSVDGGAFTETENNVAMAEVAEAAGVALGAVAVVLGTTEPPPAQVQLPPTPAPEPTPTPLEQVIDVLARSKTLDAQDKAALEALKR